MHVYEVGEIDAQLYDVARERAGRRRRSSAPVDAGRDRPRARAQAELARTAYADAGEPAKDDLEEVETWLSSHAG